MSKIHHIYWEPSFLIYVDEIDTQHRKLFDIANRMVDIYESNSKGRLKIIEELVDYSTVHFRAEQKVMIDNNYPAFHEHLREHNKFIDKVGMFLQGLRKQEESLSLDIVTFLIDWISTHMSDSDLKIGQHILKFGPLK